MKNKNKKVVIAKLDTDGLAAALSRILNNPNLPTEIYNGIMRGLNDAEIQNDTATQQMQNFTTSPEYLKTLFAAVK
jgi:glycosyltransferase involved in cell wall biosynthesis